MKKISLLLITSLLITAVSCSKTAGDNNPVPGIVTSGTWHVSLFVNSGTDETSSFSGYGFEFSASGTLTATKGSVTKTGTWSTGNSSNKLVIDLGPKDASNLPYGEISKNWKLISSSSTEIKLGDDNTSSNEYLTFTKN